MANSRNFVRTVCAISHHVNERAIVGQLFLWKRVFARLFRMLVVADSRANRRRRAILYSSCEVGRCRRLEYPRKYGEAA